MGYRSGAFEQTTSRRKYLFSGCVLLSFFLVEVFAFFFLSPRAGWPLAFGALWAVLLTALVWLLPPKGGRILYGILYYLFFAYATVQSGYYILFGEMMWLSDFRYASEGADYFDVLLGYPAGWWAGLLLMAGLGALILWKFPRGIRHKRGNMLAAAVALAAALGVYFLPQAVFLNDNTVRYASSDYGRMQSAEAAYDNLFNTHRLYQVCGVYQTAVKDIYEHWIYPVTPGYANAQREAQAQIDSFFSQKDTPQGNEMTGCLAEKNVILILMESMDDWMIGEHTPTISRLMNEGIQFTRFYTPGYGGIRTFNTEFCINTGSFLSSRGGYAFDYVTNHFDQSLANTLIGEGYSALTFHYNDPSFYSRGVFSPAMGYEEYVSYQPYTSDKNALYDDLLLFDAPELNEKFFRPGKKLNFIITRSAHLSYKYNEVLSHWGLKKYPEYRNLTDNEETNCALLKARLVDDLFARLLEELEAHGELENTVIVAVTDHYTYGYKNEKALLELSGVEEKLLLEKTPCFIWSKDLKPMEVSKVLNTSDLLPTLLNLMGLENGYSYIGTDAFDERYDGFVPFSNGSWIWGDTAYDASKKTYFSISGEQHTVTAEAQKQMQKRVQEFVNINNQILQTDYYESGE